MARRVSSPVFVGRAQELGTLQAALRRAREGEPGIVIVEGDAGIGKTRLVRELSRRAQLEDALVLAGSASATGLETAPFGPLVEALRSRPEARDPELIAELTAATRAALGRLVPPVGTTGLHEMPQPSGDPLAQGSMLEGILDLVGRLSERLVVLLVLEDLHWADRSTLAFLAFISRNLRTERVLVVATVRTDDLTAGDPVARLLTELTRAGSVERVRLGGLDLDMTRTLVEAILGQVPPQAVVDTVHERSGGNPFYAEELLAAPAGTDDLSPTLREIVSEQVARLSEPARRTLRAAAVAGADIDPDLLAVAIDANVTDVDEHLREGLEQHLLAVTDGRLAFRHALVREIIYAGLLGGERRHLHRRMAVGLEAVGVDTPSTAAGLARHWDAGNDPRRAFDAHLRAADLARGSSAPGDEQRYVERAIELADLMGRDAPSGIDLVALRRRAAEAAITVGDFRRAVEHARVAVESRSSSSAPEARGGDLRLLAEALLEAGDFDGARTAVDQAAAILSGSPSIELARTLAIEARMAMAGDRPSGLAVAERARAVAREVGAPAIEADATNTLGVLVHIYGDSSTTIGLVREALRIAREAGDTFGVLRALNNLATLLDEIEGRTREALDLAREGYETAQQAGVARTRGSSLAATVADLSYRLGEWDAVEQLAGPAIVPARRGGFQVGPLLFLARVRLARGDLEETERWLTHVETVGAGSGWAFNRGLWWIIRGRLELARDRPDAALNAAREGLALLAETALAWPTLELTALGLAAIRGRGRSMSEADRVVALELIARGRSMAAIPGRRLAPIESAWLLVNEAEWSTLSREPAAQRWAAAIDAWRQLGWPYDEASARLWHGEALLYEHRPRAEAAATLREARQVADALGALPLRRSIDELARRAGLSVTAEPGTATPSHPDQAEPERTPPRLEPHPGHAPAAAASDLSKRELEVLRLVAEGRTNGEIGRELFVTTKTASSHVAHILDKLGASSRTEAAIVAERLGLLRDPAQPQPAAISSRSSEA